MCLALQRSDTQRAGPSLEVFESHGVSGFSPIQSPEPALKKAGTWFPCGFLGKGSGHTGGVCHTDSGKPPERLATEGAPAQHWLTNSGWGAETLRPSSPPHSFPPPPQTFPVLLQCSPTQLSPLPQSPIPALKHSPSRPQFTSPASSTWTTASPLP